MVNEIRVFRMGKVLENTTVVEDGNFQVCVEIGMASFGLEKFEDLGSYFKGKIMNRLKRVYQGN